MEEVQNNPRHTGTDVPLDYTRPACTLRRGRSIMAEQKKFVYTQETCVRHSTRFYAVMPGSFVRNTVMHAPLASYVSGQLDGIAECVMISLVVSRNAWIVQQWREYHDK